MHMLNSYGRILSTNLATQFGRVDGQTSTHRKQPVRVGKRRNLRIVSSSELGCLTFLFEGHPEYELESVL
jgi:hypothetical protein